VAWSRNPLRRRQVRWQVARHPDLATAQRLQQRPRPGGQPRAWPTGRLRMPAGQGGVGGALPGVTFRSARGGERERRHRAVGFGRVQCAFQGVPGGGRAAGRAGSGRLAHARLSQPGPPVGGNWAVQGWSGPAVVAHESSCASRSAAAAMRTSPCSRPCSPSPASACSARWVSPRRTGLCSGARGQGTT